MNARSAAVVAVTALLIGCTTTSEPSTAVVHVGPVLEFRVQLATTADQQRQGLSGRTHLPDDAGMLFQFDNPDQREVWTAGMKIPIDVAWIIDGQILAIDTLDPCTTPDESQCPRWTSPGKVNALLEVPAESLHSIEPGASITVREGKN